MHTQTINVVKKDNASNNNISELMYFARNANDAVNKWV